MLYDVCVYIYIYIHISISTSLGAKGLKQSNSLLDPEVKDNTIVLKVCKPLLPDSA